MSELYLYDNNFNGMIPSETGAMAYPPVLDVSDNLLTGTNLPEFESLQQLSGLYLEFNKFTGTIPSELGNLKKLTILFLNDNRFTGIFPINIENDLNLEELCLKINNFTFTGNLPEINCTD
ncbi:hypothetical protein HJC23_013736 [Cyclotella cryptica]|uniref:L domain-like protein n=1 Tax=Cyclotella cryptica TaxID=29204 RepID=A0ABD3PHZ2_9STRA|eukprot:CCRYP_014415-RB/>CCRYP_014415-RB protein AED:0.05 eAED:-0.01 QI:0/-1/0/1/-1/1/1/0/120